MGSENVKVQYSSSITSAVPTSITLLSPPLSLSIKWILAFRLFLLFLQFVLSGSQISFKISISILICFGKLWHCQILFLFLLWRFHLQDCLVNAWWYLAYFPPNRSPFLSIRDVFLEVVQAFFLCLFLWKQIQTAKDMAPLKLPT